jgi:uncharacterized protein involved in type VI secretion and phage assembly
MTESQDTTNAMSHHTMKDAGNRYFGVYTAIVTDAQDPEGLGRVRIRLPWTSEPDGEIYEAWARVATMMAGAHRGTWFIPEPDDEVLIAFQGGNPRIPLVLGSLWNGQDAPPQQMDSSNNIRSITSRSGIVVTFDDDEGEVTFSIETPGGQKITCQDTPAAIEIRDATGNSITMDASGISLSSSASVKITASVLQVAAGMVTVDAAMSRFSGTVQSDTNITNTTISATYSPGAGNIW